MYLWITKFYNIKAIILVNSLNSNSRIPVTRLFLLYSARTLKPLPAKYISFRKTSVNE